MHSRVSVDTSCFYKKNYDNSVLYKNKEYFTTKIIFIDFLTKYIYSIATHLQKLAYSKDMFIFKHIYKFQNIC